MLFSMAALLHRKKQPQAYSILKTKEVKESGELIEGLLRHPLYQSRRLIIDQEEVAKQYLLCLQNGNDKEDITYTLVYSNADFPLWGIDDE